jgi:hypothetical protein
MLPNLVELDHKLRQRLAFLNALCLGFGIRRGCFKLELTRLYFFWADLNGLFRVDWVLHRGPMADRALAALTHIQGLEPVI